MKVINETVLLNNIKRLQKTNPLMLVVKDDAYGFGMNRLVLLGEKLNITSYGVRNLEEAVRLRSLAKKADILIFGKVKQDPFLLRSCDLIMTVNDYDDYLFAKKYKIRAHLAIDVGMNRFGMKTGYLALINDPLIEAIYTHLYQEEKKKKKSRLWKIWPGVIGKNFISAGVWRMVKPKRCCGSDVYCMKMLWLFTEN